MNDEGLTLDPDRCVLIVQDLQNDVMIDGGAFADSGAPQHAKEQNVVENLKALAETCRSKGIPVLHVHYIVEEGARGLKLNAPLFQGVKDGNALVRGTWGAAPAEGLEPQEGDFVVEKMRMNAWEGTKLESLLKGFGRTRSSSRAPGRTCRSSTRRARAPTRGTSWSCPRTVARR